MRLAWLFCGLAALAAGQVRELVVSADGSGQFRTVQSAVDAAAPHSVIRIKPGSYKERVVVPPEKTFLTLRGDDAKTTVITFDRHAGLPGADGRPINTFDTPTVFVQANDFTAENLTFANSAGPQGQAVALTIMSDRGVFRNCRFLGYQDTLLPQAGRQYFDHCYIEGAVDFIFGGSAAYFDQCDIHVTANGYITAANTTKDQEFGYVFSHCRITGAPGVKTFLGRPWRPYAATIFLNTEMSDAVRPEGWNNWNDPAREKTVRYGEYPTPEGRVPWARRLSEADARALSIEKVLGGIDGWNPKTGAVRNRVRVTKEVAPKPASLGKDVLIAAIAGQEQLATSSDGYHWKTLDRPVPAMHRAVPSLAQGPDGMFHLLWTAGKIYHSSSKDLTHWSEPKLLDFMAKQDALDVASPHAFWDDAAKQFVVSWASTMGKNFIQAFQEDVTKNPRIWFATTRDFETFSEPKLLFDNNYAVRDAVIIKDGAQYRLIHNDNSRPMQNLRVASGASPTGPWGSSSDAFTPKLTELPSAVRVGDEWWIYHSGGLVKTRDFWTFTEGSEVSARPASVIRARLP